MKNAVSIFSELGHRLESFGEDAETQSVVAAACADNGWFSEREVRRAVAALRSEMLCETRLTEWLAQYDVPVAVPRNILIVMAGNIPLVGFSDLLCCVCAGHRALVKPSAKDRVLMEWISGQIRDIEPLAPVKLHDESDRVDAVIATGSNNANRYFRARYGEVPSLLRGSRQSVAVLSGHETAEQLAGLADDIWAYSGLGCRNVSMLFLPRGYIPQLAVPDVNAKYRNNCRQQRALLDMRSERYIDLGTALLIENGEFPAALSTVHYTFYDSLPEVEAWLAAHDDQLQCVVSESVVHSRRIGFGRAQSPSLTDYADDADTMAFLENL